ncbi:hypothetical protein Lalb_Chr13g0291941 [Lupinus albus]|uniref:Uncharacterized protein n=1 Tax=Lupinus albus TaxID=3870 RepID=A0A6A4PHA3_LUPAL|nr:hypothetical protein Lalb_Chr13g0291941 [Lupinus albus]
MIFRFRDQVPNIIMLELVQLFLHSYTPVHILNGLINGLRLNLRYKSYKITKVS